MLFKKVVSGVLAYLVFAEARGGDWIIDVSAAMWVLGLELKSSEEQSRLQPAVMPFNCEVQGSPCPSHSITASHTNTPSHSITPSFHMSSGSLNLGSHALPPTLSAF